MNGGINVDHYCVNKFETIVRVKLVEALVNDSKGHAGLQMKLKYVYSENYKHKFDNSNPVDAAALDASKEHMLRNNLKTETSQELECDFLARS